MSPYCALVMSGDRLSQRCDAERVGITDRFVRQGVPGRLAHGFGRLGPGLADFEVDHIGAGGLTLIGGAQHIHGDEGRDQPPPRHTQTHPGIGLNSSIP